MSGGKSGKILVCVLLSSGLVILSPVQNLWPEVQDREIQRCAAVVLLTSYVRSVVDVGCHAPWLLSGHVHSALCSASSALVDKYWASCLS
jgi:hypothetical protein